MRLFDRLRDPFFEPRHACFEFVEPRIDLVETPQHARFEARDIVTNIENLTLDGLESAVDQIKPARYPIETLGDRLMKWCKSRENIFVFHRPIERHHAGPTVSGILRPRDTTRTPAPRDTNCATAG
jgi:hypothetical protein